MSLQSSTNFWSLVCHSEGDNDENIIVMEEWNRHLQDTCTSAYQQDKVLYNSNARKVALERSDFKKKMEIADGYFYEMLSLQLLLSQGEDATQPVFEEEEKPSLKCLPSKSEDAVQPATPAPVLEEGKTGDVVQKAPLLEEGKKRDAESQKACCSIM